MQYASITIGRNVKGKPMKSTDWHLFKTAVCQVLTLNHFELTVQNEGVGRWEGQSELNYHVSAIRSKPLTDRDVSDIRHELSFWAWRFHQDAIAFATGQSNLISAKSFKMKDAA
jgi:hypothetical protein